MNAKQLKHNNSLARWAVLLRECKESGLPVKEWLVQNNIPKDTYYYWKRELEKAYVNEVVPKFVALPVQSEIPTVAPVTPLPQIAQVVQHETEASRQTPAAVIKMGNNSIELYDTSSEVLRTILEALHA